jgi:alpha-glucosidase
LSKPVSYPGYEAPDGDPDYRLILRPHLADVVAGFARLTSRIAFSRRWSLGCYSRYREDVLR